MRQVFIVRFWHEASRERSGAWRGSVDHVDSGQRLYFAQLEDLEAFIRRTLDKGAGGPVPSQEAADE
jgi:hypothetical protein